MFSSHTLVTGGTFIQQNRHVCRAVGKGGFELLKEAVAPGALHDSVDRMDPPKCHANTRRVIIERIVNWVLGKDVGFEERKAFMMWLYGGAGAGKSAIAQTIAELCKENGTLVGSFFFSRTDPRRNNARSLISTLSYQIALKFPESRNLIVAAIEHDPLIFSKSLETQLARLVFEPCSSPNISTSPRLIVIDGLDECEDNSVRCSILRLFFRAHRANSWPPSLRILVASRPELDIMTVINSQPLVMAPNRLVLDDMYNPEEDIRRFLLDKFEEIKANHPHRRYIPMEWPSEPIISALVETSSGHFIYPSTVMKYVSSVGHKPANRLEVVLGLRPSRRDAPFADLDALYTHIFSTVDDIDTVLRILGFAILGRDIPCQMLIEGVLDLEEGDVDVMLSGLQSIVSTTDPLYHFHRVQILHKSLEDFLLDDLRSKDLYLDPARRHAEYAHLCYQYFLRPGPFHSEGDLCDSVLNSFAFHYERALPNPELRQDLMNFTLNRLYGCVPCKRAWPDHVHHVPRFFSHVVDPIFSIINASEWEDAEQVYAIKEGEFDELLRNSLSTYYEHPDSTLFLALIALDLPVTDPDPFIDLAHSHCSRFIASNPRDNLDLFFEAYSCRIGIGTHLKTQYLEYITEFLQDPHRCRESALNEERYADAAFSLLNLLCADETPEDSRVNAILPPLVQLLEKAGKSTRLFDYIADIVRAPTRFRSVLSRAASAEVQDLVNNAVNNYTGKTDHIL